MALIIFDELKNVFKRMRPSVDSEVISGSVFAMASGVGTSLSGVDIFVTLVIAFVTGILGAAGAHVFKVISRRLQDRRNKKIKNE